WMSGSTPCQATFHDFASVLGYRFRGTTPCGIRIHSSEAINKNRMRDLYGSGGMIGSMPGLLPPYDSLARIFRENICPSGGNNDNIVNPLAHLLMLAKEFLDNEDPEREFQVDVMDFIYNEMYDAMVCGYTIPYAPYIMLLIKDTLKEDLADLELEEHSFKKIYVKKSVARAPATSASQGEFMTDARGSARQAVPPASSSASHVRKLSWFQRHILCMNIDIRKEQFEAYRERHAIRSRLPSQPNDPPVLAPLSYERWNAKAKTPWVQLEKDLLASDPDAPAASSTSRPRTRTATDSDDEEDEEVDEAIEDDDEEEDEEESASEGSE
ncbi:hypothetical protein, partial [Flavobacterium sp.]|uniref:hypothetical protein n=1 Tax=Flavobacterium sp. TaxID=239 RepID=UPI003265C7F9